MESYIQYKRFVREIINPNEPEPYKQATSKTPDEQIELFFKELVAGGWTMIYYNEKITAVNKLEIVVVAGKKQQNVL